MTAETPPPLTVFELDALREAANIGSGGAARALEGLLRRPVTLGIPDASLVPLEQTLGSVGSAGSETTVVILDVLGDVEAIVILAIGGGGVEVLCRLLGAEPGTAFAASALGELGNILSSSYLSALAQLAGLELAPSPPRVAAAQLEAIVTGLLLASPVDARQALLLECDLELDDEGCLFRLLLVPTEGGAGRLLHGMGVGA